MGTLTLLSVIVMRREAKKDALNLNGHGLTEGKLDSHSSCGIRVRHAENSGIRI
jgi:hypothetical protein